ncbi:winged helix-turn-helix domain-containing protein [Colwellia sp. D2M02]|uniref:winged helix-turn-helix domain-containing protein n=1 Tax=Colwellia sp. D2M02 TaxID=2841562 RepID=UPI001C0907DB|nr:winged helix-turn-helix domain-containing protein [Colwellia sp. D2M02]MBU2893072.1 winged helix-turn-helix domain-containing protein [Colwellia sp. D2M02]
MPQQPIEKVKVNEVEVDFVGLKLLINNEWLAVEARQLKLLHLFVKNHGKALSRNQIMNALWSDTIVSDNSVSQAVTQLRKSLHDDKDTPRFIKTVPRVGYQLIAELTFPEQVAKTVQSSRNKRLTYLVIGGGSALLGIGLTMGIIELAKPSLQIPHYSYESRLTSTPGPESYLRYSPQGRYLAFSQSDSRRSQMDLAVYDAQSQSVHVFKSTGYSEEAAEWSPDGNWLIYYRHDPISCEIRVMSVSNPVETWRLSPDFHLAYCEVGFSRQKMHWYNDNTLYVQQWQNNQPILTQFTLSLEGYPSVIKQEQVDNIAPILMDLDKTSQQLLFVEKKPQGYVLQHLNLQTSIRRAIEQREQEYWGLKWNESEQSFWLGNENLRLVSLNGESEVVHLPIGFIPDIDLNPINQQLAHAEGLINVNLYTLQVKSLAMQQSVDIQQLSSSARTDILPTLSSNGRQTAFVSYQRRSMDGLKHVEIWLKNKDKKAANLLVNLQESILPRFLLWSANSENLLLGDSQHNLYLINIYSRHMVPIISDYKNVEKVNWSSDGKQINFTTRSAKLVQNWRYDMQLSTTELISEAVVDIETEQQLLSVDEIRKINPSYKHYREIINVFLTHQLAELLPVENLAPSFMLYRPYIFDLGIYYVVKQGNVLTLYLYHFESQENIKIANIGNHEQDTHLMLNISASSDGKQLAFSKVEGFETDILLQKKEQNL